MLRLRYAATVKCLAAAVLLWMCALDAVAQTPGKFVGTGSTTIPRSGHTATLLRDGRVLITGGDYYNTLGKRTLLASAELYDPSTGTFTRTGDMTTFRTWHTATLLSDGRVLIAGGSPENTAFATSSEVYDPGTGLFTKAGNMAVPHTSLHDANLLANGKVLITGGSTELYDPATDAFTLVGTTNSYGSGSTAILRDGRLLVPGIDGISLYDTTSDSLKLVAKSPGSYAYQTTTVLANGKVLIAGGEGDAYDRTIQDASIYDPRRGSLQGTGLLLFSRDGHTATLLPGGHVLIVGGYDGDGYDTGVPSLWNAEDYDPSTGSFASAGTMAHLRLYNTATLLPDGRVLIAGGDRYEDPTAELYVPPLRAASSASLNGPLAPNSLASLFGSRLAAATASADPLSPPTTLSGISLRLVDSAGRARLAPLLYVSPSQINFEVPAGTPLGNVSLEVVSAPTQPSQTTAQVNNIAPGLFAYDDNTVVAYALRLEPNGKQTVLSVRETIVLDDRPVYLIAYATGIRNRSSINNVRCTIGGISQPVEYAGPEGSGVPGLDQVNLRLTPALKGLGVVNLVLSADGVSSNTVSIDVR